LGLLEFIDLCVVEHLKLLLAVWIDHLHSYCVGVGGLCAMCVYLRLFTYLCLTHLYDVPAAIIVQIFSSPIQRFLECIRDQKTAALDIDADTWTK
jgi:hypothetical protein